MTVWFPEEIRYERTEGAVEIVCPGCRERVVADVHKKIKDTGRVGRCRLCGFFASLPDSLPPTDADDQQFLVSSALLPLTAPFVAVAGSPYENDRSGGMLEFTKERALLAAIVIALKWHRTRVFWTRTIFLIIAAVIMGFILGGIAFFTGLPWLAYLSMGVLFLGVFYFHRRLIMIRTFGDVKTCVSRFTGHFGVSLDGLVQAGFRDGGDFKTASHFLRRFF